MVSWLWFVVGCRKCGGLSFEFVCGWLRWERGECLGKGGVVFGFVGWYLLVELFVVCFVG